MTISQIDKQVNEKLKGTKFICANGRILIDPSQEQEEPTLKKRGIEWDAWAGSFPGGNIDPGFGYPSGPQCDPEQGVKPVPLPEATNPGITPAPMPIIRGNAQYISDPKNKPVMTELKSDKTVEDVEKCTCFQCQLKESD